MMVREVDVITDEYGKAKDERTKKRFEEKVIFNLILYVL